MQHYCVSATHPDHAKRGLVVSKTEVQLVQARHPLHAEHVVKRCFPGSAILGVWEAHESFIQIKNIKPTSWED